MVKKIEVLVGCNPDVPFHCEHFPAQIDVIFNNIADFKNNGGCYFPVNGRFEGQTDDESFALHFYCEEDNFVPLLKKIRDTFDEISPKGVKYISVKSYDIETHSFELGEK